MEDTGLWVGWRLWDAGEVSRRERDRERVNVYVRACVSTGMLDSFLKDTPRYIF